MRVDTVGHVAQEQPGALLALVFDIQSERTGAFVHRLLRIAYRNHCTDFIAPDGNPTYRLEHLDLVDVPADGRFPQDGLEHRTGGRRRHHVVAYPLDLHLRPGEAGEIAADFKTVSSHFLPLLKRRLAPDQKRHPCSSITPVADGRACRSVAHMFPERFHVYRCSPAVACIPVRGY